MDLLDRYKAELQHLRGRAHLFARRRPKIAARLGLEEFGCSDPFVERLLQSYGLISALVQSDIAGEFPVFPGVVLDGQTFLTAPTPSMAVLALRPDPGVAQGSTELPEGTRFTLHGDGRSSEYRLGGAVRLWPLEVADASYHTQDLGTLSPPRVDTGASVAGTRLVLKAIGQHRISGLGLDDIRLHAPNRTESGEAVPAGMNRVGDRIMRLLMSDTIGAFARSVSDSGWREVTFSPAPAREHLLAPGGEVLAGHRLLRESILLPGRMRFVEVSGLSETAGDCVETLEILFLHSMRDDVVEDAMDASSFRLGCALGVNLYEHVHRVPTPWRKASDAISIELAGRQLHRVVQFTGEQTSSGEKVDFVPLGTLSAAKGDRCYRAEPLRDVRFGREARTDGLSLRLVDRLGAPLEQEFRQLVVTLLCSDAATPVAGDGRIRCEASENAPLAGVELVEGPIAPGPPVRGGRRAWRLLGGMRTTASQFDGPVSGVEALRELVRLHEPGDRVDSLAGAIQGVECRAGVRRLGRGGRPARGRYVTLDLTRPLSGEDGSALLLAKAIESLIAGALSERVWMQLTVTFGGKRIGRFPPRFGLRSAI